MSEEERSKQLLAKAAERAVTVDSLPRLTVKTTLQHAVQLLKRHRSNMFGDDPDDVAPPSIIITTLAGQAYARRMPSGGPLEQVLDAIIPAMLEYEDWNTDTLWIPNPGYDQENYADRFRGRPDRLNALREWLDAAESDFALGTGGLDKAAAAIDKGFGSNLGALVAKRLARDVQTTRQARHLGSTAAGVLTYETERPHSRHEFYGRSDA